jgi:hypothetical protein
MITRSLLAVSVILASPMAGAQTFDHATGHATARVSRADTCGKPQKAAEDRCLAAIPETIVYGSMSDHGPGYDTQGNPIDRHGNIVAVPAGRAGTQQVREVFASQSPR